MNADSQEPDAQPGCSASRRYVADELRALYGLMSGHEFRTCGPVQPTYPFLDRRLVQFMLAIPFEQRVRPGQTRYLHRKALAGILPRPIETRTTKGGVTSSIHWWVDHRWPQVQELLSDDACVQRRGLVDLDALRRYAQGVRVGSRAASGEFLRVLAIESWLRHFERFMARTRPKRATATLSTGGR